jgi:hypothetical protein
METKLTCHLPRRRFLMESLLPWKVRAVVVGPEPVGEIVRDTVVRVGFDRKSVTCGMRLKRIYNTVFGGWPMAESWSRSRGTLQSSVAVVLGLVPPFPVLTTIMFMTDCQVEYTSEAFSAYEFPTLRRLEAYCLERPRATVLYLHNKGASRAGTDLRYFNAMTDWRR